MFSNNNINYFQYNTNTKYNTTTKNLYLHSSISYHRFQMPTNRFILDTVN